MKGIESESELVSSRLGLHLSGILNIVYMGQYLVTNVEPLFLESSIVNHIYTSKEWYQYYVK